MRKYIPYSVKRNVKLLRRFMADAFSGTIRKFAKPTATSFSFPFELKNKQVIRQSYLYENKIHNLKLGKNKIEEVVIFPNEVFSFWKTIGNPTEKNGFKKGRNIINGTLSEDVGGGLCQLSGIVFHTALKAGLTIAERFNHTVDIYKEEDRLSPLGTDATVVYGYKDLRIKNAYDFPIRFVFEITNNTIICTLQSEQKIVPATLTISRNDYPTKRTVTVTNEKTKAIYKSSYKLP